MKVYVLIDSCNEYYDVFSSAEKAIDYAVNQYYKHIRKGIYWDNIKFSRTEKSEDGKYIDIYFSYKKEGHEDEEGNPYTIIVKDLT